MTSNLQRFIAFAAIWTIPYYLVLHSLLLGRGNPGAMTSITILFVVLLSTVQRNLADRDDRRSVRYDLDLRYSIISIAASSLVFLLTWVIVAPTHSLPLLIGNASAVVVLVAVNYLHGR